MILGADGMPIAGSANASVGRGIMRNVGARNAAMFGGGKLTAKDYVQDGLIAMFDSIENDGFGRYDQSKTSWDSLIGNHSFGLKSGIFFDDHKLVSGVADKSISCKTNIYSLIEGTIEAVFSYSQGTGNYARIWCSNDQDDNYYRFGLLINNSTNNLAIQCGNINSSVFHQIDIASISPNVPHSISFARSSGSDMVLRVDKDLINLTPFSSSVCGSRIVNMFLFGQNYSSWFSGSFYRLYSYSTRLKNDELIRNYEIDKARFNLP